MKTIWSGYPDHWSFLVFTIKVAATHFNTISMPFCDTQLWLDLDLIDVKTLLWIPDKKLKVFFGYFKVLMVHTILKLKGMTPIMRVKAAMNLFSPDLSSLAVPIQQLFFIRILALKLEKKSLCYHEIVFSGEEQFGLNGYVNKQNCSILIDDQPEECQELPVQYQYPRNNGVIKKSCSWALDFTFWLSKLAS